MKNFDWGGRGLLFMKRFSHLLKSRNNRSRTLFSFTLPLLFFLFSNTVSAQEPRQDSGADGLLEISELSVGDTLPDALWTMKLNVFNHLDSNEVITLDSFRDKELIILDFWATWCGSCVDGLYKSEVIERETDYRLKVIPVNSVSMTKDSESKIRNTLSNIAESNFKPFTVVDDNKMLEYFPHVMVPHLVWIDSTGVIIATTTSTEFTLDNIKKQIQTGKTSFYKHKVDIAGFDETKPILGQFGSEIMGDESISCLFSTYVGGIPKTPGTYYRNGDFFLYRIANNTLSYLVMEAYKNDFGRGQIPRIQYIFPEDIPDTLITKLTHRNDRDDTYLFEISSRQEISAADVSALLKKILREKFHIKVSKVKRRIPVIIATLKPGAKFKKSELNSTNSFNNFYDAGGAPKRMQNRSIFGLFNYLSGTMGIPIDNQTGLKQKIDVALPDNFDETDKVAVEAFLNDLGIETREELRDLDHLLFETVSNTNN
ncbi:TlpA disulfide reductase family protein [Sphingobacterium sp. JB170]|uniref:TlpA disulfide reductase family protein n=1 Tax=Sphingobacterium sp. JB170 TaxID=1434842 RepID=UPI00097F0E6F|nr:TlpA disulfide reductase family protein [Sphingobacterium sp. JB170]SJN47920.1 Thioredoxin [Sphingobacterium sp. JB170]